MRFSSISKKIGLGAIIFVLSFCLFSYTKAQTSSTTPTNSQGDAINLDPVNETQLLTTDKNTYNLLSPLGSFKQFTLACTIDETGKEKCPGLSEFLGIIFSLSIALAGVLAVVMIMVGGWTLMYSDSFTGRTEGKQKIYNAIIGLVLALGSYLILNTINPDLVNLSLQISGVSIEILEGDTNDPISNTASFTQTTQSLQISCPGTGGLSAVPQIANGFKGKTTYKMGGKGTEIQNGTVLLDCSGYTNRVLQCAGVSFVNGGTSGIFSGAEAVSTLTDTTVNNIALKNGDLVGWMAGGSEKSGHVMVYVGGGQVMDSHSPSGIVGKAIGTFTTTKYKDRIKFIKRAQ